MENRYYHKVTFLGSAATFDGLPPPKGKEFAIVGRSNVGKSSFINHILANRSLARTSKKPGKTSLANFYQIDNRMMLVDLPGYGYAKVSHREKSRWSRLIADYCEQRPNLSGIIWLLDIRHVGVGADKEARQWLDALRIPIFPILTKSDKLSRSMQSKHYKEFIKMFQFATKPIVYSIHDNMARERFWEQFDSWSQMILLEN